MLQLREIYSSGYVKSFFCDFIAGKSKRYLFGTNQLAEKIANLVEVDGFINTYSINDTFLGKPCIHTLEEVPCDALVVSCVISWRMELVNKMLASYQFRYLDHVSFIKYGNLPIEMFHFSGWAEDIVQNFEKYEEVYEHLEDDKSKNTFFNLVNYKYSGDPRYIRYFEDLRENQYFEPFLNLPHHPVFADVGGYQGETSIKFMDMYPDYKKIYFFEPEEENLKKAKEKLASYQNIVYVQKGCYSDIGEIAFSIDGSSSMICKDGNTKILLDKLDNMVSERIDFIKMDIEGAEGDAIEGMKRTILDYHSTMAVCVYHKPDDFWKITQQVLSIRNDYKLYMRHYSPGVDETVMFFIPA